ncbi:hypothetical protein GWI33_015796 [Rhynchophorus ferrugineus]|uniref:Uncharacterized protein n=1 Tax=Rhynchophorus ferrugineus TaxID=354439 RepID=A0A834I1S8_RHYFE|nr:hypothetical protein GWI33_015796 [Rhynchophorus ferrugineus]
MNEKSPQDSLATTLNRRHFQQHYRRGKKQEKDHQNDHVRKLIAVAVGNADICASLSQKNEKKQSLKLLRTSRSCTKNSYKSKEM